MNKIQTRIVSLLVAITITIGLLPGLRVNAEVVKEGTCGEGVSWTLDDEGTLTISGTGAMSDYSIAEAPWNNYRTSIQEIVISDGVTSIGNNAFYLCSADSISIPESVTSIGSDAFYFCGNLNNVVIPASVTKLGGHAFDNCHNLSSITIKGTITDVGNCAFQATAITEMPNGLDSIPKGTFAWCDQITSAVIPDSVTTIGDDAFFNCTSLTSVTIGSCVTSIGDRAFKNCTSLTNVTMTQILYDSIDSSKVFYGINPTINKLPSGYCGNPNDNDGKNVIWAYDDSTKTLTISGTGDMADYGWYENYSPFYQNTDINNVIICSGITSIGECAFYECKSLTDVTMSKDLYDDLVQKGTLNDVFEGFTTLPSIHFSYTVDYKSNGNGTITGTTKSFGTDQIVLTVQPDNYYVLDKIEWSDGTNSGVLTESNGKYTMPESEAGAVTLTATFKLDQKTVTFKNEDGTVLQSGLVDCGTTPAFIGATPAKAEDDKYTYTFAGWSDGTNTYGPTETLPTVTEDVTYTAVFDSTVNQYIVKFVNEDGTVLQTGTLDYGTTPTYSGATPTKAADDQYTYTFSGWTPAITSVTGNATYTATFTETLKPTPAPATPAPTPDPTPVADEEVPAIVSGIAHVQDVGNVTTYMDPETSFLYLGTEGQGKRLESITLNFENPTNYSGTLEYRVHVQDIGWTDWVTAGNPAGTVGQSKRIEAIEIRLTGELADNYSVFYGVHIQDYGDMQGWVQDGALAGTTGESKRIEALAVVIVPKGMEDNISVQYRVHVQDYGWESSYAADGKMAGTSGQSKRLEGIEMFITGCPYSGGIQYKTHVQDYGWESSWTKNGEMSGTQGQSKRLEGICIELYGEVAEYYDIYYRVHAQDIGWMAWAKNGECAGTAGRSARLEGIQIVLVPKGDPAPGATYEGITAVTDKAFIEGF